MELWVWLAVGAALGQNLRSALQKSLTARVGVTGATFARFVFAAPLALAAVAGMAATGLPLPRATPAFAAWALAGALGQIAGTLMLLALFRRRGFAVGNAFAKTETVQAALLGAPLLGDRIGAAPLAGILTSLAGVLILSGATADREAAGRAAALGLACGAAFALSGVAYRAAILALDGEAGFVMNAAFTLAAVTLVQTVLMAAWLRRDAVPVLAAWRRAAPVGAAGMAASFGWFAAFALATAAEVKAVGQVELVFAYLTGRLAFGERPSAREVLGMGLVGVGIVTLVLGG
jgi:drug/metabolite transporter (DMT)-like permease